MELKDLEDSPYDIYKRVFEFCKRILDIAELLPETKTGDVLRFQLVKSGTSLGANLNESDGTLTTKDFIHKLVIARKEDKETRFWLRLISEKYIQKDKIEKDIDEIRQILLIISSIIINTENSKIKNLESNQTK